MEQNEKVQKAISDIAVIKQTMGKSRVQMKRLSQIFLLYGILQFVIVGGRILSWLFWRNMDFYISLEHFLLILQLSYVIIAVPYLIWRNELKKIENNYTLYLYDIWGFALFIIPTIWLSLILLNLFVPQIITNASYEAFIVLLWLAEQLIFFLGIAVTGFLLNSKDWKILSVLFLCLYFASFLLFGKISIDLHELPSSTLIGNYWGSIQFVWSAICPFISILLSAYFCQKKKH